MVKTDVETTENCIAIYPGGLYHYGASSDPDSVLVDRIDGSIVSFYRHPYRDTDVRREHITSFRHLARCGTLTKLRQVKEWIDSESLDGRNEPVWATNMIRHYVAVLEGMRSSSWRRSLNNEGGYDLVNA